MNAVEFSATQKALSIPMEVQKNTMPSPELKQLNTIIQLAKKRKNHCLAMKCSLITSLASLALSGVILISNPFKEKISSPLNSTGVALFGVGTVAFCVCAYTCSRGFFLGRRIIRINYELRKTQILSIRKGSKTENLGIYEGKSSHESKEAKHSST